MEAVFDEGEHVVRHVPEHSFRLVVTEVMPTTVLVGSVENRIHHFHVEGSGVGFFAQLVIIQNFDEHEIGNLLDYSQRIGHAESPENVPNAINLVFQFASNHVVSAPFSISFTYGNIIANIGKHFKRKGSSLFR